MRRRKILGSLLVAGSLMLPSFTGSLAQAQQRLEPVTFSLAWLPIGETAGWYVALDKKYFAEAGLDVTITRGFGSVDTLKRVGPGKSTFGVADIGTMILQRNREGIRARAIAMYIGRAPHAVLGLSRIRRTSRARPLSARRPAPTGSCSRRLRARLASTRAR
jgi:NitT/TauT family transport system substrate-binding protein